MQNQWGLTLPPDLAKAFEKVMPQFPHDRFNKNLLELRLSPFGEVSIQRSIDPETTFIDIYFVPQQPIAPEPQLSLLAEGINGQAVAFELYRNPVEVNKIQGCIIRATSWTEQIKFHCDFPHINKIVSCILLYPLPTCTTLLRDTPLF